MADIDLFIKYIQRIIVLTEEELTEFTAAFIYKKIKKKQYIIQPDFPTKYRTYVLKGSLRSYVIDHDGVDHTIQFALEDWWVSDINSYIYQTPATMFVVAMEDSEVLQIEYETEQRLKRSNHKFETFFRITAERTAAFHQRRIISSLTRTAEERYNDFLEKYPLASRRLPQYVIASYLGMTTEFLSKIRNRKVHRKISPPRS